MDSENQVNQAVSEDLKRKPKAYESESDIKTLAGGVNEPTGMLRSLAESVNNDMEKLPKAKKEKKIITELNEEQKALMPVVRDFWINLFNSCPPLASKEWLYPHIKFLYGLAKFEAPSIENVIICKSPLDLQIMANAYGYADVIADGGGIEVNGKKVTVSLEKALEMLKAKDPATKFNPYNIFASVSDFGWVAFYDFFSQIKDEDGDPILDNADFNMYRELMRKGGIYDIVCCDKYCFICGMPEYIKRFPNSDRLHSEDSPAIRWSDDFKVYFWNGIEVPEQLIMHPETIDKAYIMAETNPEKRRCIMERLGDGVFAERLGVVELDSDTEYSKVPIVEDGGKVSGFKTEEHKITLLRTEDKDTVAEDYIYFVRVVCPSTGRTYYLTIDSAFTKRDNKWDVWTAVSWTFKQDRDVYKNSVQIHT